MDQIYDVAVIGAGPSGIAAACYAAKFGARTVLIEKDSVIGGTAFKAYVNTLKGQSLSLMDGLLSGITKKAWHSLIFDHESLLDRYYQLLGKQPVSLLTGHEVISADTDGARITSLLCASPSGKAAISAKIIIDATGTLGVENLTGINDAGAPAYAYMTGLIGKVETVGGKCYSTEAKRLLAEKTAWARENSKLDRNLYIEINPTVRADIAQICIRYYNSETVNGNLMRRQMNSAAKFLQEFGYGFENASLICSSEVFYSAQGSFNAKYTLELSDIEQNRYFSDQVAALPDGDGVGGRLYFIPYGSLLSKSFDNLLLCGRNIGAAENAIERIDAIPTHFETGKAAGIAAAIAVKNDIGLGEVSPYEIKSKTEDSVSDKIEILNEEIGPDGGEQDFPAGFDIDAASEKNTAGVDISAAFHERESAGSEHFGELDKMLELLGEDILKPTLNSYDAEMRQFAEDAAPAPEEKAESGSGKTPPDERKNEIESLIEGLYGLSGIPDGSEEEADAADGENTVDVPEPAEDESSSAQEEYSSEIESSFAAIMDEDDDGGTSADAPEPPLEQDHKEESADEPHTESEQPLPEEPAKNGVVVFGLPPEPEAEQEQPEENAEPLPEHEEPAAAEKNIVSSDDVINMLYDSDISKAVRSTPAYYIPEQKINKDDLGFLYENGEEQKPEKTFSRKDKVDSMLDLIYEITEPSERPEDSSLQENKPQEQEDVPAKKKNDAKQSDKFKSIKDFLYDKDEE